MDMIPVSSVRWDSSNRATIIVESESSPYIPHDDPVYLAGGFVHRVEVTMSNGLTETQDFQLCDVASCCTCSGPGMEEPLTPTGEFEGVMVKPVVHSQDV